MLKEIFIFTLILISIFFLSTKVIPFSNEDSHILRVEGISQCIKDRQIPCRWILGGEFFYGSPIFNFYPPLPYYFGQLSSYKLMFLVSLLGSYISMYFFTSKLLPKLKAHIVAIGYSFIAYFAIIFHTEGLGISWGLIFFPLILLKRNLLFSSLFLSAMMLSTNAAYFFVLTAIWIVYLYLRWKKVSIILHSLAALIFAFFLSAFYIFPSIFERNLVHGVYSGQPLRFLPKSALEKPQMTPVSPYQILTGESTLSNFEEGSTWFKFEIKAKSHTIIRLSRFYFPNFKIFIDGQQVQVEYKNNSLGLMTIILGEGNHVIEGRLFDTTVRTVSNTISIFSFSLFIILFIIQFKKVRNWFKYYRKAID